MMPILFHPKALKRILIANIALWIILLTIIKLSQSEVIIFISYGISLLIRGATFIYLCMIRWHQIIPPRTDEGAIVEFKSPLSIRATMWWTFGMLFLWSLFENISDLMDSSHSAIFWFLAILPIMPVIYNLISRNPYNNWGRTYAMFMNLLANGLVHIILIVIMLPFFQ